MPRGHVSIADALEWATRFLASNGVTGARKEARLILQHVTGLPAERILAHPETDLSRREERAFQEAVTRRARREPLQYIIGEVEFCGRRFAVDRRVLVPRPETELLAEAAVTFFAGRFRGEAVAVADVGTGSGVLAVTLALEILRAAVHAVDISTDALSVARKNVARAGVAGRVNLYHGNLLTPLAEAGLEGKLHGIVANLPYLADRELEGLMPEVGGYEPRVALSAGPDALDAVRELVAVAPAFLRAGGGLFLEIGPGQADPVGRMLEATGAFGEVGVVIDYAGIERIVATERGGDS